MLKSCHYKNQVEAGCDEAGRGCLAGSVYAAAVIFPPDYTNDMLNDSKQLDTIVRSVCDRLGIRYKVKTEAMKCAETRLRANVLCNWLEIGN